MASWPQTFSVNNKYTLTLECTEQSYSIENNTSVVYYKLTMATAPNSFTGYSNYRTTISVTINGTVVYSYNASRDFNPSAANSYSEVLTSGTTTVVHQTDGSKNCSCAASVSVASGDYSPGSASISETLPLTTIPRASTASWSGDFVIGTAKTITITRASSSFTHKLTFNLGSKTVTPTSSAGTSYSWTPSASDWSGQFPTQTSRTGTFTLYTYNGGTLIGSNSYSWTLKIPDAWKPTVSLSLSPSTDNPFLSGTGLYVAGYSKIRAAATATAATGASIASYTFSGALSKTVTTSAASTTQTSGVIATSGSKTVTVTVTDARGRTGTASASCSFVSYAYPAISSLSYARGTYSGGVWTSSDSGEDLRVVFSASCSLSGNGNSMTYSVPVMGGATGANTSGQSITLYRTGIGTVTAYTVTVTVTDSVGNSSSRGVYVPTVEIPFVLDPQLPAIGVGAVPQTARTLELASNWLLNVGAGAVLPDTTDILATAVAQESGTAKAYRGTGASYTGTVPNVYFGYGTFLVLKRYATSINVLALSAHTYDGIALNFYNGSSWTGWDICRAFKSVTKSATVSFSAGTIGTRGFQTSWTASQIGGNPYLVQITEVVASNEYHPFAFISGTTVYLNAYRCVSSAVAASSNRQVYVTIYYR